MTASELRRILASEALGSAVSSWIRTLRGSPIRPRYRSGIQAIDSVSELRGLTVLCGTRKAGKSMLGLKIGILAAFDGWKLLHVDCELDAETFEDRFWAACGHKVPQWLEDRRYVPIGLGPGAKLKAVAEMLAGYVWDGDEKILLLLDSVHRLAKREEPSGGGPKYWAQVQRVTSWCEQLVKLTHGGISVVAIAESTRDGAGAAGLDLEYAADALITLRIPDPEKHWRVDIEVARRYAASAYLKRYSRNMASLSFDPPPDPPVRSRAVPEVPVQDPDEEQRGFFEGTRH